MLPSPIQRSDGKNGALRNGQHRRADRGVIVVLRREGRNDQVVRVVAALEENADQRLVIGDVGLRHGGVHEAQSRMAAVMASSADSGAGGTADEIAA